MNYGITFVLATSQITKNYKELLNIHLRAGVGVGVGVGVDEVGTKTIRTILRFLVFKTGDSYL